jgi:hypothetical protein
MPKPSTRLLRSLQGGYDAFKQCCSHWNSCLDQMRYAPPSDCTIDEYVGLMSLQISLNFLQKIQGFFLMGFICAPTLLQIA